MEVCVEATKSRWKPVEINENMYVDGSLCGSSWKSVHDGASL